MYEKKIVNGEEKHIIRLKYSKECRHVKLEYEYKKYLISKVILRQVHEPSNKENGKKFIQDDTIKNCISHLI